jgi:xylulose-5-phosphate/fructose-6-phosphate phosphoketolase
MNPELLHKIDAYWRAANYLSVGQIYLYDNPLLKRSLVLADLKLMQLRPWVTTPGQNFFYVHLNRIINLSSYRLIPSRPQKYLLKIEFPVKTNFISM